MIFTQRHELVRKLAKGFAGKSGVASIFLSSPGRLYRDARVISIYESTSQVQQMVIASKLLK